jgi:hypothetical protein
MKVALNLAADTASVAKLDLFKFVPFRLEPAGCRGQR